MTEQEDLKAWKHHEKTLAAMVRDHPVELLHVVDGGSVRFHVYYCNGVERLVGFLTDEVKKKELSGPHNTFAIYFKYFEYGDIGYLEYAIGKDRVDIYIDLLEKKVQVKSLTTVTPGNLREKAAVVDKRGLEDELWIFFFQMLDRDAIDTKLPCEYLLQRVTIDLLDSRLDEINPRLKAMSEQTNEETARKLKVPEEIIIPLPNLVSDVEWKRRVTERDRLLEEKDKTLEEKDKTLEEKDKTLEEKERRIKELEEEVRRLKHQE